MQELMQVQTTWVEKAIERGRIEGQREVLLHQLSIKFGMLPDTFIERIEAITDNDALDVLSEQVLLANSLAEIHLPDETDNL